MGYIIAGVDISLRALGMVKFEITNIDVSRHGFTSKALNVMDENLVTTEPITKKNRKFVYKNADDLRRASVMVDELCKFTSDCDIVFIELPVGSQSARAEVSYGISIGVAASLPSDILHVVTPDSVKDSSGVKNASKDDMLRWAMKTFPNVRWIRERGRLDGHPVARNHHIADACASAIAGIRSDDFKKLFTLSQKLKNGRCKR